MNADASRDHLEKRAASAREEGRDAEAVAIYEKLLADDLAAGNFQGAVAVYQRVILWKQADEDLHRRLARMIALARDAVPAGAALGALPATALLAGIPPQQLARALEKMVARRFASGTAVIREGEPGDALFLITDGQVEVETRDDLGDRLPLAVLGAGDFFGEVALLTALPRTATVMAITDLETLELSREALDSLRSEYPDLSSALAASQRARAERTAEALNEKRRHRT